MPTPRAVDLGSRRELFADEYLIASMAGGARLLLHQPVRREVVFTTDAPWEGNACGYPSIVHTDDGYRIYHHGLHYRDGGPATLALRDHPQYLCCLESRDGLHWHRADVGLFEFQGSRANNIVLAPEAVAEVGGDPAHTAVFRDTNPDCPPEEQYKVVMLGNEPFGLYLLGSPDGYGFSLLSTTPAVTRGTFDSQNLMFWDPVCQAYREYHRDFRDGLRDIMTATSSDPLHFPEPQWLEYPGMPVEQLYTNQIAPYYRAPHILLGFPARYVEREWADPLYALPGLDARLARARAETRFGAAVTDTVFMVSRDGLAFRRYGEAFIRPGPQRRGSWVYGDNYTFWGMIETPAATEDAPPEISFYSSDHYWEGTCSNVRRYSLRLDGFVSANAPLSGGEIVTRPLTFAGGNLSLNLETSAAGAVQVEVQDAEGRAIEGHGLADCPAIFGDSLEHVVRWRGVGGDLRPLAGCPVRLRFVLHDADVYSFQFVPYAPDPALPDLSGIRLDS